MVMIASSRGRSTAHLDEILKNERSCIPPEIDRLHRVFHDLRYEGKIHFGENLKEMKETVRVLKKKLFELMYDEEKFLFPFLILHVPRLQPLICLLLSEHQDFKRSLKNLRIELLNLGKKTGEGSHILIQKINDEVTYFICLLRSHLWMENKNIYRVINRELNSNEKDKLLMRLVQYEMRFDQPIHNGQKHTRGFLNGKIS